MPPTEFTLWNETIRFSLDPAKNTWSLEDRRAGVTWGNTPDRPDLPGTPWVHLLGGEMPQPLFLRHVEADDAALSASFLDAKDEGVGLQLVFRLAGTALQIYLVQDGAGSQPVSLFSQGLDVRAGEGGEALLPIRMGLLLPAEGTEPLDLRLDTYAYEGLHMAMSGLFKSGAALMAAWHDPYTALHVVREVDGLPSLRFSFELSKSASSIELYCLGPGDYHLVADAYRDRATALGYRLTWDEKMLKRPQAARLFGVSNFKLWTALARRIDENLVEQSVDVRWTFDEAAQIAEHLKRDLALDEVLFHLGGWSRYGYDCRHPDNMPANPECGGDEVLADCARRVQDCGYLFCLHDNYQDMYRDAPSWGEAWIQKNPDGSLVKGGVWLGGQAYYTCAREALKLAQRPQNLPLIHQVADPDAYFIDTTYAVGPQECFDPRHPLTRQDDIHWKQALSDYARDLFGLFGSECGREWAVPHSDFFEGLSSVSGGYYHNLKLETFDGRVVPIFDMVFHDCITIHGKYGYDPAAVAEQVAYHASIGRTFYYHSVGPHLYWQDDNSLAEAPIPDGLIDPALYTRGHHGWADGMCLWDRFLKNTHEILSPLARLTAQAQLIRYTFLDADRRVCRSIFNNGAQVTANLSHEDWIVESPLWGQVVLPPYGLLAEVGTFAALAARSWNGHAGTAPALFTFTSLDGQPLETSRRIRVFHGFGDDHITWRGVDYTITRQLILEL